MTERIRQKNVFEIVRDSGAQYADRIAFRSLSGTTPNDPARDVTYAEMLKQVIQAANLFHAEGIGPNDTVTILMPGVPETFVALWGAEIGAVANPVNYFLNASQIAGIMKEAGAKAADRRRPVAVRRHLAQGRGDPRASCPASRSSASAARARRRRA